MGLDTAAVYYLVLNVKESDCWVLTRKYWADCEPVESRRVSEIVIGQCKVIATKYLKESEDLEVKDFNCTTSSVSSALANHKDSPVLLDFFEDTEPYRKQANKALEKYKTENSDFTFFRVDQVERVTRARGGERTKYYVDFSVRNCSRHRFHRHSKVFGFCKADFLYDTETFDLETPINLVVNCEVFDPEEHGNFSHGHFHHPFHSGTHEPPPPGRPPFKPGRSQDHHHGHKLHKLGSSSLEDKDHPDSGVPALLPPPGSRCYHPIFYHNQIYRHSHNHNSSEHQPHGHHPHGPHRHGQHSHGHKPHRHHSHRHHPHGGDFHDHGPCDPLPQRHGFHHDHHSELPPNHSKERGPGKRHFPFHWRKIGYVYQLPPLNRGEVLPVPEANFPRCSFPNQNNPLKPEVQPFPQSVSESCPGAFKNESHLSKFFENATPPR
ncbi:histidine-rich glycoprotein [Rhynchocyon petersi]